MGDTHKVADDGPKRADNPSSKSSASRKAGGGVPLSSTNNVWTVKTAYLYTYNCISAILWLFVLMRVILLLALVGPDLVAEGVDNFVRLVQSLALLEVAHSLFALVKSPISTTLMQVASRLLLVWGITKPYPQVVESTAYSTMLIAWSITEVIRYSFYAANLRPRASDNKVQQGVPDWLIWLRYTAFFILYPLGVGSELTLIGLTIKNSASLHVPGWYTVLLSTIIAIYIPGFYTLFTHMIKQRSRAFKNLGKKPATK